MYTYNVQLDFCELILGKSSEPDDILGRREIRNTYSIPIMRKEKKCQVLSDTKSSES